jgi:hypothetical protein
MKRIKKNNMKKIFNLIICLGFVSGLFESCSHEQLELYSGCESGLFIQQVYRTDMDGNPSSYNDSVEWSFSTVDENVEYLRTRFYVRTIGKIVDYDRPFILKVNLDESTAIEGLDFDISENEMVIPANENMKVVTVRLLRTEKLKKEKVQVVFTLEPNEYFEVPIETYKNTLNWSDDATINSAISYKIIWGEIYTKPSYWNSFGNSYFGTFSVTKFMALNKCMGWKASDWSSAGTTGAKIAYGRLDYAATEFQKYLQALADAGTPLTEEDGSYVQLPTKYAVNYSAYTNQ